MKNGLAQLIDNGSTVLIVGTGATASATEGAPQASWIGLVKNGIDTLVRLGKQDDSWGDPVR